MPHLKFKHVFAGLMALAAAGAFLLPQRLGDSARAQVQGIFWPISRPTRLIAGAIHQRVAGPDLRDEGAIGGSARSMAQVLEENTRLRVSLANLVAQLDELRARDAERTKVGPVLSLCEPFAVSGADTGARESLSLSGSSLEGVRQYMPVLYSGGVAGWIQRAGIGGAQVQLITDQAFRATGSFMRLQADAGGGLTVVPVPFENVLVEGIGQGMMRAQRLSHKEVQRAGLRIGDWVVLSDRRWPQPVQGYRLGQITNLRPQAGALLFDEALIQPSGNLLGLREVMVMTRE